MQNPIIKAKQQVNEILMSAIGRCISNCTLPKEPIPPFLVEIPSDTKNGDMATNVAMVSAKAFKMPPIQIAEIIMEQIILDGTFFDKVSIAGPGFINFYFSTSWFYAIFKTVLLLKDDYGRTVFGANKKIMVEFVSANPTGPMHIGNARGGAIGDCLASVLQWSGHDVTREFYINDAGNQVNKLGLSLEVRYLQQLGYDIKLPEDAYKGDDIIEHSKNFIGLYGNQYLDKTEEERRNALVAYALPINIKGIESDLQKYRIEYDIWFKESTLHNNGEVQNIIDLFKKKGHTYEKDGALWFNATKFGEENDFVLVRANGVPTYVVPDIAYHYNKLVTRGFDKAIDVLGADHHGYIPRLKSALKALDVDPNRLDAILIQMVRLIKDGEIIKASKRSGKAITLITLLDEVDINAARFYFNLREPNSHFDFDLDLAVDESSKNPVFYVQYAHARICSILRNLLNQGVKEENLNLDFVSQLTQPQELELINYISKFPNEIIEAAKIYDPTRLTKYAVTLANLFHKFYNECRVNSDNKELTSARATLCLIVKITLNNLLRLLKIDSPESM